MLKRFIIVSLAVSIWMASGESRAADTIELTPNNVVSVWQNINNVILVLSANIAMDDEWIDGLRNLKPAASSNGLAQEMAAFQEKLNLVLTSSELETIDHLPYGDSQSTPALYVNSGALLDNLIFYLIDSDTLASIGIYYGGEDVHDKSEDDVVAQVNLANQRLDAFIEENGL